MGWFSKIAQAAPQVLEPVEGGSTQVSGGQFSGTMNQLLSDPNIQSALEKVKTGQTDVGPTPQAVFNPFRGVLTNANVLPEQGYQTVGPGSAPANIQPISKPATTGFPDFVTNSVVFPEQGYQTVGASSDPANIQPINQAPALSPQQAMQFLGGQNPFIRPQEQGIGSLFRRLMQQ